MEIYSDWQNIAFFLTDADMAFVENRKNDKVIGSSELIWLVCGLKVLRSRTDRLNCCILGYDLDWHRNVLEDIKALLGFSSLNVISAGPDAYLDDSASDFNVIIDSSCSEIGREVILNEYFARSSKVAVYFQVNMSPVVRHDAQISQRQQIASIRAGGFEILQAMYFGVFVKGCFNAGPHFTSPPSAEVQKRCLFVVGHARSGSSAIQQVLNGAEDTNILFEGNFHIRKNLFSMVENFNSMQQKYGRPIDKGFLIPPYYADARCPGSLFEKMQETYSLVGDKMAYGARWSQYDAHPAKVLWEFVIGQFPHSSYVITLRHPKTALPAMARIAAHLPFDYLIDFWLGGVIRMIDLYLVIDRAVILFHEDGVADKKLAIHSLVQRDLGGAWEAYREENISTSEAVADVYWQRPDWIASSGVLQSMGSAYSSLRRIIGSGRAARNQQRPALIQLRQEIQNLYSEHGLG